MRLINSGVLLCAASPALGQLTVDWSTIDGGGIQNASGGTLTLSGTIGQHDAGPPTGPMTGGTLELRGGFWSRDFPNCLANWNNDDLVNTSDFLAFLNDYNAVRFGGTFMFRDPDLAVPFGVINTSDFLAFLNIYNAGC